MRSKLGIIAGGGRLPRLLIETCIREGRPFHVIALQGQAEEGGFAGLSHEWIRLGAVATAFRSLRAAGIEEVVFAGKVSRPSLADLRPDWHAAGFLARIGGRLLSDNRLVEAVLAEFEGEGFRVVGPADVMRSLLARPGHYGRQVPTEAERASIDLGLAAARHLGLQDRGQAAVVQGEQVLGLEGPEGTDALIEAAAQRQKAGRGAILVKARKPQQQMRADPPVIGPSTVQRAGELGYRGIAVETGAVLVLEPAAVGEAADACGMFAVGIGEE